MNCPEDYYIDKQKSRDDNVLTIVYTGAIWEKVRGLENIVAAIKDLTNVELVLAGWYRDKDKPLLDQILRIHNVKFEGLLQPKDALVLEASADVMIALYEPELLWNNITLPNKLFEAMMCGIPLITNVASKVVSEVGFGIVVKYHDVQEIRQAILTLRDDVGLRKKLGSNGRKAYLEKYSWAKMEEELLRIYDSLEQ
jgi:glycosyltransferase involved in cell wall biosynthesis